MKQSYENHVLLGAGGAITRVLVDELAGQTQRIILVSRRGVRLDRTEGVAADLMDRDGIARAIPEGSAVYLLAGLPYDVRVWRENWPRIMENTLAVCREKHCLLVFFDNVYMYGPVDGSMTEATPYRPTSRKGEVRARIADRFMDECTSGRLDGIIARSADFYGPGAEKSGIPNLLIFERLLAGKAAQWLASLDKQHSLTYTGDCGRALVLLASERTSYGQVWHLPTARPPLTMRRFAEMVAAELGVRPRSSVLSPLAVRLGGIFDRTIGELFEMLYQDQRDYIFDSSKFERSFSFSSTPYAVGIAQTLAHYQRSAGTKGSADLH